MGTKRVTERGQRQKECWGGEAEREKKGVMRLGRQKDRVTGIIGERERD